MPTQDQTQTQNQEQQLTTNLDSGELENVRGGADSGGDSVWRVRSTAGNGAVPPVDIL